MNRTTKIKITELNPHVICVLCGGYYINATTIVECLHSFCRTCITRYLETSKYCPICDVMVHKTRPLEYIRSDKTLQDLVYKLVPCLYKREMKRRREYYAIQDGEGEVHPPSEDRGNEFHDRIIYTEDEKISLSLELCAEGIPFKTPSSIHGHTGPGNIKVKDVRYLRCPAAFSVGNLKKFIRMKFDLKQKYEIDIFQTAEPLQDYYTLMDIAYIYTWTRRAPLRLYYTVYQRKIPPRKGPDPITCGTTVAVNSPLSNTANTPTVHSELCPSKKRKLPDGPGDISPDFDLDKSYPPVRESHKDGNIPRKRAKKLVIDSSVLEAMSESEEQLAKLTLNSSMDAVKDDIVKDQEDVTGSDSVPTPVEIVTDEVCSEPKTVVKDTIDDNKEEINNSVERVSPGSIRLSLFQPLNVSEDKRNIDDKVFEFPSEQPSITVPTLPKPKGKPGRKKKNPDAVMNISNTVESNNIVIPKTKTEPKTPKHKKTAIVKIMDKSSSKETTTKQSKSQVNDAGMNVEKVKRKYVRKNPKVPKENCKENASSKRPVKPNCLQNIAINANSSDVLKHEHDTCDVTRTSHDQSHGISSNLYEHGMHVSNINLNGHSNDKPAVPAGMYNETSNKYELPADVDISKPTSVLEPTTPLYGQTPKVTMLGQGLPNSPSPDFAENDIPRDIAVLRNLHTSGDKVKGAISNHFSGVPNASDGTYNEMFGINSNNHPSHLPIATVSNTNGGNVNGFSAPTVSNTNGGNVNGFSAPTVSNTNGVNVNGFSAPERNSLSGIVKGYVRNVDSSVHMNDHTVSTMSSMTSSNAGGISMDSYPRFSVPPSTIAMGNGYTQMELATDQPLDLTSSGLREEYTKGKIFKTKMLKKSLPKSESPGKQTDKGVQGIMNGLRPQPWM